MSGFSDEWALTDALAQQHDDYVTAMESEFLTKDELGIIRDSLTVSLCLAETGCAYLNATDTQVMDDNALKMSGAKRRGPTEDAKPLVEKLKALIGKVAALL